MSAHLAESIPRNQIDTVCPSFRRVQCGTSIQNKKVYHYIHSQVQSVRCPRSVHIFAFPSNASHEAVISHPNPVVTSCRSACCSCAAEHTNTPASHQTTYSTCWPNLDPPEPQAAKPILATVASSRRIRRINSEKSARPLPTRNVLTVAPNCLSASTLLWVASFAWHARESIVKSI